MQTMSADSSAAWVRTASGSMLRFDRHTVTKRHHPRTDREALTRRLALAADCAAFVPPVDAVPGSAPDGRLMSRWPRVPVLSSDRLDPPWSDAGALLAALHVTPPPEGLPRHGWASRLTRAAERAPAELRDLGAALAAEASARVEPALLVHGDWHLGQLGHWTDGWRLLDVDDAGLGDPAWDLARPAGFWAAGLLPDDDWAAFLDGYREAGGPAVPPATDPWPALDLPARAAVFVAAVRTVSQTGHDHSRSTADPLLAACRRMAP